MKTWTIHYLELYLEYEVNAEFYIVENGIGLFWNEGELLHSVPADKTMVLQTDKK